MREAGYQWDSDNEKSYFKNAHFLGWRL
jgi:hypothetical protein